MPAADVGPLPAYPPGPASPAPDDDRHYTWPASLTIGVAAVGILGVLGTAPFWALCGGVAAAASAHYSLPDQSVRLLQLAGRAPGSLNVERAIIVLLFLAPLIALSTAWGAATPRLLWSPWWLVYGVGFGFFAYAFALRRGGGERPQRWWWAWLPLAILVVGFFAVGGPFRVRWAYCEARLTDAVVAGEVIEIANTGRFCWHDTEQLTVDGERRLYFGSVNDANGLVYSPAGAIEESDGIRLLRELGGGWYYFEEGSAVHDFWFDG